MQTWQTMLLLMAGGYLFGAILTVLYILRGPKEEGDKND